MGRKTGCFVVPPDSADLKVVVAAESAGGGRGDTAVHQDQLDATGWLQVACIATTLRHLSRERARRRLVALAA